MLQLLRDAATSHDLLDTTSIMSYNATPSIACIGVIGKHVSLIVNLVGLHALTLVPGQPSAHHVVPTT